MADSLTNELIQLQKSRSGFKYSDGVENYVKDIPGKLGKTINRPLRSINRNMLILARYRGKMLFDLERRFYASWRKIKKLTQQF